MSIDFELLNARMANVTAFDALDILCWTCNADTAYVTIDATRKQLVDLYDDTAMFNLRASDVEIQFYGGPPPARWWTGDLLMLLKDHFLHAYSTGQKQIAHNILKKIAQ
jgi:hypothetical protein